MKSPACSNGEHELCTRLNRATSGQSYRDCNYGCQK